MTDQRVIMFVFAGRQPNMELQLPYVRRILELYPNVEYHVWNLTRCAEDNQYVRSIRGDRITVYNDFQGDSDWGRFNDVFRHYTKDDYQDCLFVKLDDDVVFIQTDTFGDFLDIIDVNRSSVVSAKIINNGACTPTEPALYRGFRDLGVPLLDVHKHCAYANLCHEYMFGHWPDLLDQPISLIPTDDWLSINFIGYDWEMGRKLAFMLGTPSPTHIAGRNFSRTTSLGDEGAVNTLPRIIVQGFLAAHLTFGPQNPGVTTLSRWRNGYKLIADAYLKKRKLKPVHAKPTQPKAAIIIPFRDRGRDPLRQKNLDTVLKYWEDFGVPVYVVDDGRTGDAQFNRSAAYNIGSQLAAKADILIYTESDMLVPYEQMREAITLANEAPGLVVPLTDYTVLSERDSADVRSGYIKPEDCTPESVRGNGVSVGCVNVINQYTLELIGQWDEQFEGSWYDDTAMNIAFRIATKNPTRPVPGPGYHLYHLPGWTGDHLTNEDRAATERNKKRLRLYRMAQGPDRIRALTAGGE